MRRLLALIALLTAFGAVPVAHAAGPVSIELPNDDTPFPDLGPGAPSAEAINNNCRSCHSASMVMVQPRLKAPEWAAEVAKMRGTFKAPVDPSDDEAIVAWLTAMSERQRTDG
jgi:hypothetical protein